MKQNLLCFLLLNSLIFSSGGFDNGTPLMKGKFRLDLTWNPFNVFKNGQSYAVIKYGFNDRINLHGYISDHKLNYKTWYAGVFYNFYSNDKFDLSTAIGLRKRFNRKWNHIFMPQLLYTFHINNKINIGGSFVQVQKFKPQKDSGLAIDLNVSYKLNFENETIQNIKLVLGAFHPSTNIGEQFFYPTYSIDILFK
jgi:hypothetical protein